MKTKETPPTPNHAELEKLARKLAKQADTDAKSAQIMSQTLAKPSRLDLVVESGDVYHALSTAAPLVPRTATRLAIVTCGWAAPVDDGDDDETAPSLHPRRRRVALVSVHDLSTGNTVSAIRFADTREVITDYGNARGALADAITQLGVDTLAHRNES